MDSINSEISTSKKKFRCLVPECNSVFTKNRKLISHIRVHTGERPFVCDEAGCTKTYTNSSHLIRHKKTSHGEKNTQQVMCEFQGCGLILANKYSLKKHYNRKHNPELYSFKCSECSQGFYRKRQLQEHLYLHTGDAPFSCDKCDMSFTSNSNLNKHKKSHRVYNCDCGEIFHRWSLLQIHRKFCNRKRYICDMCDRTFSHASSLKNHNFVHQSNEEKMLFRCPYPTCERSYFYKRNLKFHINNFHQKINQNINFKCTYPKCSAVLKTKQSLKMHLERHFKWRKNKRRQVRQDKGKQKKSVMSILIKKNDFAENKEHNNCNSVAAAESSDIENNHMQITDDDLLKHCDLTLKLLNEQLVTVN